MGTEIVEGLLGADVIGFQRTADAANYITAVRRLTTAATRQIPKGWEAVASLRSADGGAATPHRAWSLAPGTWHLAPGT